MNRDQIAEYQVDAKMYEHFVAWLREIMVPSGYDDQESMNVEPQADGTVALEFDWVDLDPNSHAGPFTVYLSARIEPQGR